MKVLMVAEVSVFQQTGRWAREAAYAVRAHGVLWGGVFIFCGPEPCGHRGRIVCTSKSVSIHGRESGVAGCWTRGIDFVGPFFARFPR